MDKDIIRNMTKEDICTHLGDDYERFMGAVVPPIFQNSLFVKPKRKNQQNIDPENTYSYTRVSNPTTEIAEKKVAALEEGEAAKCFGSGMAAISSAIMHFISRDSHIITLRNIYGPTKTFIESYMKRFGVQVTFVSGESIEEFERAVRPNTSLIYLESPVSFVFTMQDLVQVANLAKSKGIATVIDNSWATPLFQNPIRFGIDMVVHTASKYLGGHSDIVAGVIVGKKEDMEQIAHNERALLGGIMDPHQSWLLIRGIRTLPVRIRQHQENTIKVAEFLENHAKVEKVLYPGLKSHPQYELGKSQMTGYSGLMSFIPRGDDAAILDFADSLEYFQIGPSWGGFESLIVPIGVGINDEYSKKSGIPRGLVRIHVGLENSDTLIRDLDRCLNFL
jgi:cystathionine beta-lyase/cystathionine gamma-synthase